MKAAAEFLSGKYPNAAKAAEAHSVPGPNVSYYVRTWRGSDAVDVMIERLVDADDAAGSSSETNRDPPEPTAELEPVVMTFSSVECLKDVNRFPPGTGYNKSGTDEHGYKVCYKWAGGEYLAAQKEQASGSHGCGYRATGAKLLELTGVYISHSTIYRAVQDHVSDDSIDDDDRGPIASPAHRGKMSPYPREAEDNLAKWIRSMRAFKLAIFKCQVMAVATNQIKDCPAASSWPNGVTDRWYYNFLDRHGFSTGTYRPLWRSRALSGRPPRT